MQRSGSGEPSRAAVLQPSLLVLLLLAAVCVLGAAPAPASSESGDIGVGASTGGSPTSFSSPEPADASPGKKSRGLFSPRMDYDEWTPLGRGDPLKNDPTYDYVPPVLERVHYWIEPSSRTPDPPELIAQSAEQPSSRRSSPAVAAVAALTAADAAGVPIGSTPLGGAQGGDSHSTTSDVSDTASLDTVGTDSMRDVYGPFLKFVDGPKFSSAHQHHLYSHHQHTHHRRPSLEAASVQQKKTLLSDSYYSSHAYQQLPNQNMPVSSVKSHLHFSSKKPSTTVIDIIFNLKEKVENQQLRPPNTVLVPPPFQTPDTFSMSEHQETVEEMSTITLLQRVPYHTPGTSTQPSNTVEEANLIFHTTMPEWELGKTQLATIAQASNYMTWKTPTTKSDNIINNASPPQYLKSKEHITRNENKTSHDSPIGLLQTLLQNEKIQSPKVQSTTPILTTTAAITEVTSTSSSLTTDPLFSHYKQPVEPHRGPMYLINQGHSKVKTYGANMHQHSFHGIPIQLGNEIEYQGNEGNETKRLEREIEFGLTSVEEQRWFEETDGLVKTPLSHISPQKKEKKIMEIHFL